MRQQLLVDLHPLTLQGIDRSFHIDGIPQRDSSRQQHQSTGAIALIFRFSVPDFTQPVQEYRTHQRVTGFSFIQSRLYISLITTSASARGCAAGVVTKCKADNMRGAYFRNVLYFSVIICSGSKLFFLARWRVSSRLATNLGHGSMFSIASHGSPPKSRASDSA